MFVAFKMPELCKHSRVCQNSPVQERGGTLRSRHRYFGAVRQRMLLAEMLSARSGWGYLRLLA